MQHSTSLRDSRYDSKPGTMAWSIVAATLMVAATTADDAIWLVPYTSPSLPVCARFVNGALFVFTLEFLVCCCVVVASWLQWAVATTDDGGTVELSSESKWSEEVILGSIGAGICYSIALVLYIRKWLKRRRRNDHYVQLHRASTKKISNTYGTAQVDRDREERESFQEYDDEHDVEEDTVPTRPSPWAVISFTTIGALDEVSYFPSLLLGKIFTPLDLCVGTILAACIVLVVVTFFLSHCKPILDCLDCFTFSQQVNATMQTNRCANQYCSRRISLANLKQRRHFRRKKIIPKWT